MERVFMKGNEAIAEAAVRAGCRFFAGYPITPQNEIPEYMSARLPEVGGSFVQGESEVASINMVYGAAAAGTLAMTSSSSPGISLKSEGISYLAGSELPAVIVNVTRGGPGLGSIQAAQMDYLQAAKAPGHGGFHTLVYAPSTIQESCDLMVTAFEKAVEYQQPVILCVDGCIGSMMQPVLLPEMKEKTKYDFNFFVSGLVNPKRKIITSLIPGGPERQESFNKILAEKYEIWKEKECRVETMNLEDAQVILVAYGVSARVAVTAMEELREQGIKVGLIRPITLYPFPYHVFDEIDYSIPRKFLSVELSIPAQMTEDIELGVARRAPVSSVTHAGGVLFTADEVVQAVKEMI